MRHRSFLQRASIAVLTLSLSFVSVIPVALSNHEALPDVTIRIAVPPKTSLENVVQIRIADPFPDSIFALSQNGSTALGYRDSWNQSYANGFLSAKRVEAYTGPRIIGAGSLGSGALPTFMGFVVSASLLLLIGLILHGVLVQQSQVRQRCYTAICILERTLSSNRIELRILRTAFRVALFIGIVIFLLWFTSTTALAAISHPYYSRVRSEEVNQSEQISERVFTVSQAFQERVCARVERRFAGNDVMLGRINRRLERRFDFTCVVFGAEPEKSFAESEASHLTLRLDETFLVVGDIMPRGATNVRMLPLIFGASCDANVFVEGLTVYDNGIGRPDDVQGVWLRIGGERVSRLQRLDSDKEVDLRFRRPLLVPACEEVRAEVMADYMTEALTAGRHSFSIRNPDGVVTSSSVDGVFPLQGATFEISTQTTGTITFSYEEILRDVNIDGGDRQVIGEFVIQADGTEELTLQSITLKNDGSSEDGDFVGIALRLASSRTPFTNLVSRTFDDLVTLHFDPPFTLDAGERVTFQVTADIIDGSGRFIRMELQESSDLFGVGFLSGYGESGQLFGSRVILEGSPDQVEIGPSLFDDDEER